MARIRTHNTRRRRAERRAREYVEFVRWGVTDADMARWRAAAEEFGIALRCLGDQVSKTFGGRAVWYR